MMIAIPEWYLNWIFYGFIPLAFGGLAFSISMDHIWKK